MLACVLIIWRMCGCVPFCFACIACIEPGQCDSEHISCDGAVKPVVVRFDRGDSVRHAQQPCAIVDYVFGTVTRQNMSFYWVHTDKAKVRQT